MSERKVIFVNRFFHPDETATSQILTDLCFHLAKQGRNVHVVTSSRCLGNHSRLPRSEFCQGAYIWRVRSSSFGGGGSLLGRIIDYLTFYPFAFIKLLRLCRAGDTIVAKTDPPMIAVFAWIVAKLRGGHSINWLQDLYPEVAMRLGVRALNGRLGVSLIALRNFVLKRSDANVVIGARMADRLREMGVQEENLFLLPNWSDEEIIKPIPSLESKTRKSWDISDGTFVLAYSGNLGRAHESETILEAAKILRGRKDICFLFVGGGVESRHLERAVAKAELSNFLFKAHQPRDQLPDSLAAADAHWLSLRPELEGLIVPSKFYGIASAGRAIIAVTAEDGEVAAMVRQLDCGHAINPGDARGLAEVITNLADDRTRCEQLGARAREASTRTFARRLGLARWSWILDKVTGGDVSGSSTHREVLGECADPLRPLKDHLLSLRDHSGSSRSDDR